MFVQIEEAMIGAAAKVSMMYSRSMLISAEEVEILIQGLRGLGLSSDISTQRPSYMIVSTRGQASNVFAGTCPRRTLKPSLRGSLKKAILKLLSDEVPRFKHEILSALKVENPKSINLTEYWKRGWISRSEVNFPALRGGRQYAYSCVENAGKVVK